MIQDILFYAMCSVCVVETLFLGLYVLGTKFGEKKALYIVMNALNYLLGSAWLLALYNEPSILKSKDPSEWAVIVIITGLFTFQAAVIAWKAYTSNPAVANGTNHETKPNDPVPPAVTG